MPLRVIGTGVGRTGTTSLRVALNRLLGAPAYHMIEVFTRGDFAVWKEASLGRFPDWKTFLAGYSGAVDWPASAFWPELAEAFPDAILVHSTRDPEGWFKSARDTIFSGEPGNGTPGGPPMREMIDAMLAARFTPDVRDKAKAIAAFERWDADVRARAPRDRLVVWSAEQGWEPICRALGVPVPAEPFPRANTTEEFQAMAARGGPPRHEP